MLNFTLPNFTISVVNICCPTLFLPKDEQLNTLAHLG